MIHLRTNNSALNKDRKFACSIGPELPKGDTWFYPSEAYGVTCSQCRAEAGFRPLGVPLFKVTPEYLDYLAEDWMR